MKRSLYIFLALTLPFYSHVSVASDGKTQAGKKMEYSTALFINGNDICKVDVNKNDFNSPKFLTLKKNISDSSITGNIRSCGKDEVAFVSDMNDDSYVLNGANVAALPMAIMGVACVVASLHAAITSTTPDSEKNPAQEMSAGVGLAMVAGSMGKLAGLQFPTNTAMGVVGIGAIWATATICHIATEQTIVYLTR